MMNECSIHYAAFDGNLEKMRQLIEAGVHVDSLNDEGDTPLHRAIRYGQYEVAELLIDNKCNINHRNRYGRTPVMLAADWRRNDILDLLLHRGAQVNCVDKYGCTLLLNVCYHGGRTDIVRRILDKKADINATDYYQGNTPLMRVVKKGQEEVAALLIRAGADVNRRDLQKQTALHFAVLNEHTTMIQILLEKEGLDLSPQDVKGDTPLHRACWLNNKEVVKQLLDAGANTNVKNNGGETALSVGIGRGNLTHEEISLFVQKGAFLEDCDYECISQNNVLKESVLKDVELCTQSVVNKFNCQSMPALNSIAYFSRRLPNVDNFKLGARHIDEVRNLVKCEIEKNTFCNVVQVRPIALSALCVLSLITCQSGKKRSASSDFGQSPLKKNS